MWLGARKMPSDRNRSRPRPGSWRPCHSAACAMGCDRPRPAPDAGFAQGRRRNRPEPVEPPLRRAAATSRRVDQTTTPVLPARGCLYHSTERHHFVSCFHERSVSWTRDFSLNKIIELLSINPTKQSAACGMVFCWCFVRLLDFSLLHRLRLQNGR